jgi:uncharacterized protein YceK
MITCKVRLILFILLLALCVLLSGCLNEDHLGTAGHKGIETGTKYSDVDRK